jgi:APA family basic amino acid/polyamine antiporter
MFYIFKITFFVLTTGGPHLSEGMSLSIMAKDSEKENLKREIGLRSLVLAIFNNVIGTGIFVIPAIVAESLGTAAFIAYIICGFLVFLIAMCFAEVGSKITVTGGVYTYIETAFGSYPGFLANTLYLVGACVTADAALANGFADTLKYFFPLLGNELVRIIFFALVFGALAWLNIRSLKNGIRLMEISSIGKIVPLVLIALVGMTFISSKNLQWTSSPAIGNFGSSSLLLFFAFMGMEASLSNSGEIKNPKRTVPLGIILGVSGILILYLSIQVVTQGILGPAITQHRDSPLAAVAGVIFGKIGITLITITIAISMLGTMAGDMLAIPRLLYAGGRDGIFPRVMAKVHPRFFTPHISIFIYSVTGFLFAVFGAFKQLAILSSASTLLIYLGVVLSTLKLRRTISRESEKAFRTPGGPTVPILAILVIFWLLSGLSKQELAGISIFLIAFSFIYLISQMIKKDKRKKSKRLEHQAP